MARDELAMYGIPALAGVVTAVVLLGPGVERPVSSARVRGFGSERAGQLGLRVQAVTHLHGHYRSAALDELTLEVRQERESLGRWQGRTGDNGFAEAQVALARPLRKGAAAIEVRRGDRVLGAGELTIGEALPSVRHPMATLPTAPGMELRFVRGFAVPPFPETLEVTRAAIVTDQQDASPPRLSAAAEGADVRPLAGALPYGCEQQRCAHRWLVEVIAKAPSVNIELTVDTAGTETVWRGPLEVRQGGVWLDPEAVATGTLHVRAASPKDEVFASLLLDSGRVWGAIVRMDNDDRGLSSGKVSLPSIPADRAATVLLSTDPGEAAEYTTAWPLHAERAMVEPRTLLPVLDGLPAAIAAEDARRARIRLAAFGLVLAAGLFELLFMWRRSRLSRANLERHLARNPGADGAIRADTIAGTVPLLYLILLMGALVLAFVILAGIAAVA